MPADDERGRRVWLAHDERMGRDVVLKDVTAARRAAGHAPGEVRVTARLGHAHVIGVYEFCAIGGGGEDAGDWAVLEFASRGSLDGTSMDPHEAAAVGAQIAQALGYLHEHGIVHCDVKPGNIVRCGDGAAKLADFGSAYRIDPGQTVTPREPVSYTPGYAAPEVAERHSPVPASDVYSLAATLYALVVGAPPEPPGRRYPAGLGALATVLAGMLRRRPADRPDAAGAGRLLRAVAEGTEPVGSDTAGDPPVPRVMGTTWVGTGSEPRRNAASTVVPAQLPADVYGFAGRGAELRRLDDLLPTASGERSTAVLISAVSGTAGVGKTALAVHWAHRIAHRYRDGQLYVDLRGFDPVGRALAPADAVRGFLDALGVPPDRIPRDLDAQAGLYRSMLAGRRVLVVLDNARDSEQVRPLLPGTPGCLVVVTSRNHLVDLIAGHGARPLDLDVLDDRDARLLLDDRIGAHRTGAEPDAVDDIVTACANLPLALAVVAARAATRPHLPLATLAGTLRDSRARLGALTGEGPGSDVSAVFSWSYEQLTPPARRLFRLLGLHPGPDISAPAAASLAGLPPAEVRPLLADLTRAHLVAEHAPGRYGFHDLLRAYAAELAGTRDTGPDREAAGGRMLDHYVHTGYAASALLYTWRNATTPPAARPGVTPEHLADRDRATAWFTAEHRVLVAILRRAAGAGFDARDLHLALTVDTFLDLAGHWNELATVWEAVLSGARRFGEYPEQAHAHRCLANVYIRLDRLDDAHAHLRRSVELSDLLGDHLSQGHAERALGRVSERWGRLAEALDHSRRAHRLYRSAGYRVGEARALNAIGWRHANLGEYEQARVHCERALELAREIGDRLCQAETWDSLGYVYRHLRDVDASVSCYRHAVEMHQALGNRYDLAETLTSLGDTRRDAGDPEAARGLWRRALAIFDELRRPEAGAVRARLDSLTDGPTGL